MAMTTRVSRVVLLAAALSLASAATVSAQVDY
jgi:hypothetical protein